MSPLPSLLLPIALCAALLSGCAKKGTTAADEAYVNRVTERPAGEDGLLGQDIDLDADGAPDIKNYYRERSDAPRLLVRKELDLNRDGKIDVLSFFDADGNLEREEMDSDYDGTLDWTDH
jgi:hypothetical protein